MNKRARAAAIRTAMTALRAVADRCDGAVLPDGVGFSGTDALLGAVLAEKKVWSPAETRAALQLIEKYKKQVDRAGISREGLKELWVQLDSELGNVSARLSRYDVVRGTIWVDTEVNQIFLETDYNPQLVSQIRELVGRQWDADRRRWACTLCAENALAVQEIAERWGLALRKHAGWKSLAPMRMVNHGQRFLKIDGVSARAITRGLPQLSGQPEIDERVFTSIHMRDDCSIEIALRSWVIREARLWFETLPDDQVARLGWAQEQVKARLDEAYPRALKEERVALTRASAAAISAAECEELRSRMPVSLAADLMPHQWVAVHALASLEQCLLADEQGLGKSLEILAALEVTRSFPSVVIVPATAILNWRDEASRWLPHRKVALAGGSVGKKNQGVPFSAADLIVLNYESFDKHASELVKLRPRALVADEGQYLKTHDSERTRAVKQFCADSNVGRVIVATGTPVLNRPSELLTLLTLLPDLLAELGGFARFAARYCAATLHKVAGQSFLDFGGSANLGELANRLRESGRFIRREKASVLPTLPAKQRQEVTVEINNRSEYNLAKQNLTAWLKMKSTGSSSKHRRSKDGGEAAALRATVEWLGWSQAAANEMSLASADRAEALRRVGVLRQLAGVGKIAAAAEWIEQVVKDEKLVVFAYHIEVQQALVAALGRCGARPLTVTGDMTTTARHEAIRSFQLDPERRVIVCSLLVARTAITLTAAKLALMVELDWSPAGLEQAEDRVHRIGQAGQVTITYLRAKDTLDDRMLSILDHKRTVINTISASDAPFGYKPDGTPRRRPAGPGRPPLEASTRVGLQETA